MALLEQELTGLDALELEAPPRRSRLARLWSGAWPKLAAIAIAIAIWQLVVWSGWKPEFLLPGPRAVFTDMIENWDKLLEASIVTLQRGAIGFTIAIVIGTIIGAAVSQVRVLRLAIGSMITGLQTMPSIVWFPLAILLFGLTEGAIQFVVVLGAAPSIANGLISGVDHIPPVLLRAGRVLGATGLAKLRYVVLPASLPSYVGGLKQGWAFAWRSLMAGELIVFMGTTSLGHRLKVDMDLSNTTGLLGVMITILIIGIVIDSAVFGTIEKRIRRRYGLVDSASDNG